MTSENLTDNIVLELTATKEKGTKNYIKFILVTQEDPPEVIPEYVYIGKHLSGIKKIVINLEGE